MSQQPMKMNETNAADVPFAYPPYATLAENDAAYGRYVAGFHASEMGKGGPLHGLSLHYGERENGRVRDAYTGEWYWDCHRNGSKFNLGHRHPLLVAALKQALDHVDCGSFSQLSGYRAKLAEKLAATTAGRLGHVVFGVGGADAVEIAVHAARSWHRANGKTRRHMVAIGQIGFHGGTDLALSLSGISAGTRAAKVVDSSNTTFVPFNDLAAMKAAVTSQTAAVLMEVAPAQGGFPVPLDGYIEGVRAACDAVGALLIIDEVQTGLGATGEMWGYQRYDILPDMVVSGKGLGGGLFPISATMMTTPVWQAYSNGQLFPHDSTYAGSELGCVVACKVLDITANPDFLASVKRLSNQFAEGFSGAPFGVTQLGTCIGLLSDNPIQDAIRLVDHKVLVVPSLDAPVVPFRPIMTIDEVEADDIIRAVRAALG